MSESQEYRGFKFEHEPTTRQNPFGGTSESNFDLIQKTSRIAPSPDEINRFHTNSDVDNSAFAQHHTLGFKQGQAAPGDVLLRYIDDTGWLEPTLAGTWTNFGGAWAPVRYRKIGTKVILKGLLSLGGAATIFTLPIGFRPPGGTGHGDLIFNGNSNQNTGAASAGTAHTHLNNSMGVRIAITTAGIVSLTNINVMNPASHVSLSGIEFYTD